MLNKKEKEKMVALLKEQADRAHDGALADYAGTNVANMTGLRVQARENNVYLKVTRNTLIKRSLEGTDFACLQPELTGPTLIGFSLEEPGAVARLFKSFAKENPSFQVKCLSIGGQFLAADQIDVLASLPTRDQALAQVAGVVQAPVTKFVTLLNQVPTKLVCALDAVRVKKEQSS